MSFWLLQNPFIVMLELKIREMAQMNKSFNLGSEYQNF